MILTVANPHSHMHYYSLSLLQYSYYSLWLRLPGLCRHQSSRGSHPAGKLQHRTPGAAVPVVQTLPQDPVVLRGGVRLRVSAREFRGRRRLLGLEFSLQAQRGPRAQLQLLAAAAQLGIRSLHGATLRAASTPHVLELLLGTGSEALLKLLLLQGIRIPLLLPPCALRDFHLRSLYLGPVFLVRSKETRAQP